VTTYKSIRNLSVCAEKRESWDGCLAAVWEGRGGMGKKKEKKKEKQRKRLSAESICTAVFRRKIAVGDSIGYSARKKSTSSCRCNFQKKFLTVGDTAGIYQWKLSVSKYRRYHRWNYFIVKNFRRKNYVGNSVDVIRFSGSVI